MINKFTIIYDNKAHYLFFVFYATYIAILSYETQRAYP